MKRKSTLLAFIPCCIVGSEFADFLYLRFLVPYSHFYDDDYAILKDALAKRWRPDQCITAASMGLDMNDYGEMTGTCFRVIRHGRLYLCSGRPF